MRTIKKPGIVRVAEAIADTIREAKEVPSGHLYAVVMSYTSLDSYHRIIASLVKAGYVEQDPGFVLRWVGNPDKPARLIPHGMGWKVN